MRHSPSASSAVLSSRLRQWRAGWGVRRTSCTLSHGQNPIQGMSTSAAARPCSNLPAAAHASQPSRNWRLKGLDTSSDSCRVGMKPRTSNSWLSATMSCRVGGEQSCGMLPVHACNLVVGEAAYVIRWLTGTTSCGSRQLVASHSLGALVPRTTVTPIRLRMLQPLPTLTSLSRKAVAFCTLASGSEQRRNRASNTSGKTWRKGAEEKMGQDTEPTQLAWAAASRPSNRQASGQPLAWRKLSRVDLACREG